MGQIAEDIGKMAKLKVEKLQHIQKQAGVQ